MSDTRLRSYRDLVAWQKVRLGYISAEIQERLSSRATEVVRILNGLASLGIATRKTIH